MNITHHFAGGAYAKETHLAAGSIVPQHSHPHDHLAILAAGFATVYVDGEPCDYFGPACITLVAHKVHTVEAKTDVVWYCIWATEDTDPETVDATILKGD